MLDVALTQVGSLPLRVSFRCPAVSCLALVGPAHTGKSSILRAIAGVSHVAEARIYVDDVCWQDAARGVWLTPSARAVAMVTPWDALFPHQTAQDSVAAAVRELSYAQALARAAQVLALVGADEVAQRLPAQLSDEQLHRVWLARALVSEPRVLLLDEPFTALDATSGARLAEECAQLCRRLDIALVLATCALQDVEHLADRVLLLADGVVLQEGTPAQVLRHPASLAVARRIGVANLFASKVLAADAGHGLLLVRWGDNDIALPPRRTALLGQDIAWGIAAEDVVVIAAQDGAHPDAITLPLAHITEHRDRVELSLRIAPGEACLRAVVSRAFHDAEGLRIGAPVTVVLQRECLLVF